MKKIHLTRYLFILVTFIALSGCMAHWHRKAIKQAMKDRVPWVETYDSLGYAKISLPIYKFDTVHHERLSITRPSKYKISYEDSLKVFEYRRYNIATPFPYCNKIRVFYLNPEKPEAFFYVKYEEGGNGADHCEFQKDTVKLTLADQKTFEVDSVAWPVLKFTSDWEEDCLTLYFNDSWGIIKSYSYKDSFLECEADFFDDVKERITESIRYQFRSAGDFHSRCDSGILYLNGTRLVR